MRLPLSAAGWPLLAAALAVLDWWTLVGGKRGLGYLTKPGVIVALLAWLATQGVGGAFLLALLFSLLGDIFLMLPRERFTAGLGAFLLAHLANSGGFLGAGQAFSGPGPWFVLLLVALVGSAFHRRLASALRRRGQERLRAAVGLYALALSLMFWAALSTWWRGWPPPAALRVSLGAALFFASDALLAWNRFVQPLPAARLKVRILYHLGQGLLAWGLVLYTVA